VKIEFRLKYSKWGKTRGKGPNLLAIFS
jgi:hypothetical protein